MVAALPAAVAAEHPLRAVAAEVAAVLLSAAAVPDRVWKHR